MKRLILFLIAAGLHAQSFPTSVYTPLVARDNVSTTLASAMTIGDNVAVVTSGTGWVTNMVAYICDANPSTSTPKCTGTFEAMLVTNVSGQNLTVTRSYGGTTAVAHARGRTISNAPVAAYNKTVNDEVLAIETYLHSNQVGRAGTVMVYPGATFPSNSIVIGPGGAQIDCTGTATSCLQEAENYRYAHSLDMYISQGVYNLSATWQFHPMEGTLISSGAITLNWDSGVGSNPAMVFDSLLLAEIRMPGSQLVSSGTGPTLLFKPTNTVPNDPAFGIGIQAYFDIFAVVNIHTPTSDLNTVPLVQFDMTNGPITYSEFNIREVNASGIGVQVLDPPVGQSFFFNKFSSLFVHGQTGGNRPVVQIGQTNTSQRIAENVWALNINSANTGKAVSTFEQNGIYTSLNVSSGTQSYGIYFETGAIGNTAHVGQLGGSNLQPNGYSVGGACDTNQIIGSQQNGPHGFSITPGASPWLYQNLTCQPLTFLLSGGTVSEIDLSTTGSNLFVTGQTAGAFTLRPGAYIRTVYTVTPTATGIL